MTENKTKTENAKEKAIEFWTEIVKKDLDLFLELADRLKNLFIIAMLEGDDLTLMAVTTLVTFLAACDRTRSIDEAKAVMHALIEWCAEETKFRIENGYWRFTA